MTANSLAGGSRAHTIRAMACMLFGVALISLNDALIKSVTSIYPVGELLLLRGLCILPWVFLLAYRAGGLEVLKVKNPGGQALRALCVIGSAFLFVNGLVHLQLADAIAITFTGPLFITAMAPIALGEYVGWRRWFAVLIGFVGILFIFRPGYGTLQWAALFPLGAALCGSIRDIITRRISQTESSVAVLLVTTGAVILAGLVTVPFAWVPVRIADLDTFAACGLLIFGGHYFMIEAFRHGEAALVAPLKYTFMVWAVLYGFLFFGHLPDLWTLIGTAIVVAAGLYVLHRELKVTRSPIAAGPRPPSRM